MTFTTDLFSLVAQSSTRPNLILSPLSVALALSHLALGTGAADQETRCRPGELGGQKELASFPRAYYQALPPSGSLESLLKTQTRISMNQSLRDWAQDGPLVIFMHESGSSSVSFGLEGLMVGQSPEREGDGMRSPRLAAAEMEVKLGCPDPQEVGGDSVVSWACSL